MIARIGLALAATISISSCSTEPSPKVADVAESRAILAPLMPRSHPDRPYCIEPKLTAPLEDERRNAELEKPLTSWKRATSWISDLLWRPRRQVSHRQWYAAKGFRLRPEDETHLNALLRQASKADLTTRSVPFKLPQGVSACGEPKPDPRLPPAYTETRFSYSQPVVTGNVAFVEEGVVCGPLCGTGHLTALVKRRGRWFVVAGNMTWIA
jgi:hypothetical protein